MTALTDTPAALRAQPLAAATAAAEVLPAATPLVAGTPVPGAPGAAAGFAGAVVAEMQLPGAPRIAVLVGAELVAALASSPIGGLDLAAATQASLQAAAAALGSGCGAPREVALDTVEVEVGTSYTLVPLEGGDGLPAGALLVPDTAVAAADAVRAGTSPSLTASRGLEMLHGVDMEVTVELGRTRLTVRELLALTPGEVLELDRAAGSPADLLVNGRLIARGEVVVVDEDFGLRITEIVDETTAG